MSTALLLLADGTRFEGRAIGAKATAVGEICFSTAMAGYQETFTDPSYAGQILTMTTAHTGNYGIAPGESESARPHIRGLVCRNFSEAYSRTDASGSLQDFLVQHGVPGIAGLDTRALVRHIREAGAMNAILSTTGAAPATLEAELAKAPQMAGLELASSVSTPEAYTLGDPQARHDVAVLDYGIKRHILESLRERGCRLRVYPARTPAEDLLRSEAAGFFLSNGPGDPAAMPYAVETARALLDDGRPVFGICLGHQLLAQAAGLRTYKMRFGHHGVNHPVQNLLSGRTEITSQNHGFAVDAGTGNTGLREDADVTHRHLNDGSVAGFRLKGRPVFAVQYHPEAHPGPHDSRYLFDEFVELLGTAG